MRYSNTGGSHNKKIKFIDPFMNLLSWEKRDDHWAKVNEKTSEEFYSHKDSAFELWRLRSKFKWKVVDMDGEEITSNYQKMKNF